MRIIISIWLVHLSSNLSQLREVIMSLTGVLMSTDKIILVNLFCCFWSLDFSSLLQYAHVHRYQSCSWVYGNCDRYTCYMNIICFLQRFFLTWPFAPSRLIIVTKIDFYPIWCSEVVFEHVMLGQLFSRKQKNTSSERHLIHAPTPPKQFKLEGFNRCTHTCTTKICPMKLDFLFALFGQFQPIVSI